MSEKQPQFNHINEQIAKGEVVPATVLIERSDGSIDTGHVFQESRSEFGESTNLGRTSVHLDQDEEGYSAYKKVDNEKLSDDYQQRLARKLGNKALEGDSEDVVSDMRFDRMFEDTDPGWKPEDAAVRKESQAQRLQRERQMADERDAAMKRVGRPEMN